MSQALSGLDLNRSSPPAERPRPRLECTASPSRGHDPWTALGGRAIGSAVVAGAELARVDGIAYREAVPAHPSDIALALCLHGFPETAYMWRYVLAALADSGRRGLALDLPGFGDSPADPPGTWERQVEAVERFRREVGLERVALAVHDWGGLIGLRWACDNPRATSAPLVSHTRLFPDGKWHGMADMMRTPGQGEEFVAGFERDAFGDLMRSQSAGFDDEAIGSYWKAFETDAGRQGILELYRSGDFPKLEAYRGKLA